VHAARQLHYRYVRSGFGVEEDTLTASQHQSIGEGILGGVHMTDELSQREVIAFLCDPATHGDNAVDRMSTHGAHIFLAGPFAYKLKRAVKLAFMDYSTVERRRAMLQEEFDVNRDAAPELYVSVNPITRGADARLEIGGDGAVMDWILTMRRFDQSDLLDNMAGRGVLPLGLMDILADVIVAMHRRAPVVRRKEPEIFCQTALDNISPLRETFMESTAVDRIARHIGETCEALKEHLRQRSAQGFVRRCHGDLHLRNIVCLDGQPTPFDALEFDATLATGDVYYDLAFLLMDLDHRELPSHANRIFNRYVSITGDIAGLSGLPLFLAVRAAVRTKVAVASGSLAHGSDAAAWKTDAQNYLRLADSYLPAPTPRLLAIGGLSGTGKSRAAYEIAPKVSPAPGALVLRTDEIRKRLHQVADTTRLPKHAYETSVTDRVYSILLADARRCLEAGYSCILDAVFAGPEERLNAEAVAASLGVPFVGCWLEASLTVRQARINQRTNDASDADASIAEKQEAYDLGKISWHRIDARDRLEHTTRQLTAAFSLSNK
jgi:aminoglycoside phosphotransferase family enzyme/predicted kinase